MSSANVRFRVWDNDRYCYRKDAGKDAGEGILVITQDGFLVILNILDGPKLADDDRFIVERCTGFKDANGRLIYQGDIIERRDAGFEEKYFRRAIYFVPHYARFYEMRPGSGVRHPLDADSAAECRVIGNINENSELIYLESLYKRFDEEK